MKKGYLNKKMFAAVAVVFIVSFLAGRKAESGFIKDGKLQRPQKGEGAYETEVILQIDETEETEITIIVPEQNLTNKEEQLFLSRAIEEIQKEFIGTNESLDEIRNEVVIKESYQNGMVSAEWMFSIPGLIYENGLIKEEILGNDSEMVKAEVLLTCEDSNLIYEISFVVHKHEKSKKEIFYKKLSQMLLESGQEEGTEVFCLPKELEGSSLIWKNKESNRAVEVFFVGMVIVILLPALDLERQSKEKEKREEVLIREYPKMINKLSLLLGAGMSLRGAWREVTDKYLLECSQKQSEKNVLYEEMLVTRREIESGKGELKAYEDFGKRCALQKYRKFSNYLVQNLKKGNRDLCELLEREADELFAERKSMVQQLGETAGTKLLLPMMLMLGIVIFIIMVPAVLSFRVGISP